MGKDVTTEQQATPTSEEELRARITDVCMSSDRVTDEKIDNILYLIHQYGNTRELEGRLSELNKLHVEHNRRFEDDSCAIIEDRIRELEKQDER